MVSPCSFTMVAKSLKISFTSKISDCKEKFFRNYVFFKYAIYKHIKKVNSLSCNCKNLLIIPMKMMFSKECTSEFENYFKWTFTHNVEIKEKKNVTLVAYELTPPPNKTQNISDLVSAQSLNLS